MPNLSSRKRFGPSDSRWERQKENIKKYYIRDDLPLNVVMRRMKANHDFEAEPSMYKARFKKWGFKKNNRELIMQAIARKLIERDKLGKWTIITLDGKEIPRTEVMRYLSRRGIKSLNDAFNPGGLVSHATPVGLKLATPKSSVCSSASHSTMTKDMSITSRNSFADIQTKNIQSSKPNASFSDIPEEIDRFINSNPWTDPEVLNLNLLQDLFSDFSQGETLRTEEAVASRNQTWSITKNENYPSTFTLDDHYDALMMELSLSTKNPFFSLLILHDLTEMDVNSTCSVFGNSPLHEALLFTFLVSSEPVLDRIKRELVTTIQSLVSRGANIFQQNHAAIDPSFLAYSLGLWREFNLAIYGSTLPLDDEFGRSNWSPRFKHWFEDFQHYTISGCLPAACKSDDCEWWKTNKREAYHIVSLRAFLHFHRTRHSAAVKRRRELGKNAELMENLLNH